MGQPRDDRSPGHRRPRRRRESRLVTVSERKEFPTMDDKKLRSTVELGTERMAGLTDSEPIELPRGNDDAEESAPTLEDGQQAAGTEIRLTPGEALLYHTMQVVIEGHRVTHMVL